MSDLKSLLDCGTPIAVHVPVPRVLVSRDQWLEAAQGLHDGRWSLQSLWASEDTVHMALSDDANGVRGVVTLPCPEGRFPSVGRLHPPSIRLERSITDLFGLAPEDAPDSRPWLDHGCWTTTHPMGADQKRKEAPPPYAFLPVEGEGLHEIPVGPVHAGVIEPGHFRFTDYGETVVRLEERFGYTHKGVDRLMRDADLARGAELAGRVSGDSTVAYSWAFAMAAEMALGVTAPERALWLRALMAELERLAHHLGDIGAVCNDAAFPIMLAHCGVLRERVLRACDAAFGQRMMRDHVLPGGVEVDIDATGIAALRDLLGVIARDFPALTRLYDNSPSLLNRTVGTGVLSFDLVRQFATGGFVGRASGRAYDTRRALTYAPYDSLNFEVPVQSGGDVNARIWQRIHEVGQSLSLIGQILERLPEGPIRASLPVTGKESEALAMVEGFRGDILVWLALDADGRIRRCHLRDPSWFQWPLLEAAIEGNIVADFPLCNKSFNCSYSGQDL